MKNIVLVLGLCAFIATPVFANDEHAAHDDANHEHAAGEDAHHDAHHAAKKMVHKGKKAEHVAKKSKATAKKTAVEAAPEAEAPHTN